MSPPPEPRTDARAVARVLDRLARAEAAPWLHQEVARRMAERLPLIKQPPARWLDWWGFLGGSADAVATVLPDARRQVIEPTAALAERSQAALRPAWWRRWLPAGEVSPVWREHEVPPQSASMLWANMVLHWSPQPEALLARWHAALAADGFLMFSTLGPDTLRELRALYEEFGWPAPHPPFTDMHDIGDQLVHGGFADPVMDQETLTLHWSSPDALLAELRSLGGHLGLQRTPGLRTPRWRERLKSALAERADAQGRIALRFELVYGHAFKAAPKPPPGAPVAIPLDELRASLRSRRAGPGTS
ncbi:methyltransferase domain-containing protein [Aquabacterium humicola]|uniref:methyltransferase domain-containing protein n=1 Tax=Aquabacterium humicola TaxID=3237377 RepID=UPI0025437CEC|nr:biotin synthase [Rubrivivax pictus]